jgi:hypothetical protein
VEEGARGFFEMRDGAGGDFAAGPIVHWDGGGLSAGNEPRKPLTVLKAGEWVRIGIRATTGAGVYEVTVSRVDGRNEKFPLLPCKETWTEASYLVFSAQAVEKTAYYLDNVTLKVGE